MSLAAVTRAADFQASWYYSLILFVILLLVALGAAYALAAVRRMWRSGLHGPAAAIGGAVIFSLLAFVGMYATAIGGLIANQAGGQ